MAILKWYGKDTIINHHKKIPFKLLKENKSRSIGNTENLIIEGDNLEALKSLLPHYQNKIKCIYIDPPYNTGNEKWVYNDNVSSPQIQKWLGDVVGEDDLSRHDKWLCMMYPRLKLLEQLLNDDNGLIFISIDDNEYDSLKKIMDEIFGEENFVNTISVKMSEPTGVKMTHVAQRLPKLKEYVLFYKKSFVKIEPPMIPKEEWDDEYNRVMYGISREEIEKIKTILNKEDATTTDILLADKICSKIRLESLDVLFEEEKVASIVDKTKIKYKNAWRIIQIVSTPGGARRIADEKIKTTKSNFFIIETAQKKKYLIKGDYNQKSKLPRIKILFADDYLTVNAGDFWQDIKTTGLDNEGGVDFKNGKKPLKLIKRILQMATTKNDIILDSFAGSGTTGEAVLELNKEDGQNRKFILIELEPNICKTKTSKRIENAIAAQGENITGTGFQNAVLDKELLNADGKINPDCTFNELASYIYFSETKRILDVKKINKTLLDTCNDTEYHLIFNKSGKNNLDRKFLTALDQSKDKIIYADKCTLDDSTLEKHKIIFKQIPYEVKEF